MASSEPARLAVAYWGAGAVNQLGLDSRLAATQVLLDLRSGACNPSEIEALLATRAIVKTVDGLHSKLYWTSASAVIGSSNASSNGLGFEGRLAASNFELNVLVQETSFLGAAARWFDDLWQNDRIAHAITPEMISAARDVYSQRQTTARRFKEEYPRYVDNVERNLPVGNAAEHQQALLVALEDGPRTIGDLAVYLAISPKKVRNAIDAIRRKSGRYSIVSMGKNKFRLNKHSAAERAHASRVVEP